MKIIHQIVLVAALIASIGNNKIFGMELFEETGAGSGLTHVAFGPESLTTASPLINYSAGTVVHFPEGGTIRFLGGAGLIRLINANTAYVKSDGDLIYSGTLRFAQRHFIFHTESGCIVGLPGAEIELAPSLLSFVDSADEVAAQINSLFPEIQNLIAHATTLEENTKIAELSSTGLSTLSGMIKDKIALKVSEGALPDEFVTTTMSLKSFYNGEEVPGEVTLSRTGKKVRLLEAYSLTDSILVGPMPEALELQPTGVVGTHTLDSLVEAFNSSINQAKIETILSADLSFNELMDLDRSFSQISMLCIQHTLAKTIPLMGVDLDNFILRVRFESITDPTFNREFEGNIRYLLPVLNALN